MECLAEPALSGLHMNPSIDRAEIEFLKWKQFNELTAERTANMPAAFFKPIKYPVGSALIENIREVGRRLALQIRQMPLAGQVLHFATRSNSCDDLCGVAMSRM
ncbi:hypothetical protein D3C75_606990 [compost metagenome]